MKTITIDGKEFELVSVNANNTCGCMTLRPVEEKPPLFTTADGVDIYDRSEEIYTVCGDWTIATVTGHHHAWGDGFNSMEQTFKHHSNAKQYIRDNKPEFSRKQILQAIDGTELFQCDKEILKHKLITTQTNPNDNRTSI